MTSSYNQPDYIRPTVAPNETGVFLNNQAGEAVESTAEAMEAEQQRQKRVAEEAALEEEAKKKQVEANLKEASKPSGLSGVATELGAAALGGAMDAVGSVGKTAQAAVTGNLNNPDFEPEWYKALEEKEPMNKTVWGQILRGFTEFALLSRAVKSGGNVVKATGIPGLAKVGQFVGADGKTRVGNAVRGAVRGAVVDVSSSYAEQETLSTDIQKLLPWFPGILATSSEDDPVTRRLKNVIEGVGLGAIVDTIVGGMAASRAAKANAKAAAQAKAAAELAAEAKPKGKVAGKGKAVPTTSSAIQVYDPEVAKVNAIKKSQDSRAKNTEDTIRARLSVDPSGENPDPYINPSFYNKPDSAVHSTGSWEQNLVDLWRSTTEPAQAIGRRVPIFTEAALEQRLSQGSPQIKKILKDLEKKMDKAGDLTDNVNQTVIPKDRVIKLQAARYLDLVDAAADPDDIEQMTAILTKDAMDRKNPVTGESRKQLNEVSFRAAEMLITTTSQEIADLATGIRSVDGSLDTAIPRDRLYKRLEFLLNMTGEAKYYKGYDLQALKNPGVQINPEAIEKIRTDTKEFVQSLKEASSQDPELAKAFLDVLAFSDGNPRSIEDLRKFAARHMFNWRDLVWSPGKKTAFVNTMQTMMYNSVLSAPKTLARAISGTATVTVLRPLQQMLGGALMGEQKLVMQGAHQMVSIVEAVGEAWKLAGKTRTAMISGMEDIPYGGVNRLDIPPTETESWKALGKVLETSDDHGAKAMYGFLSMLQDMNHWQIMRYPTIGLTMIDNFSRTIVGRMQLKAEAFDKAWNEGKGVFDNNVMMKYEAKLRSGIFNDAGEVVQKYASYIGEEVTLMQPLKGPAGGLSDFLDKVPAARPFFMFMKTAYNGLDLARKHTPGLARFNSQVKAVLQATPDDLSKVAMYGITTPGQLMQEKAIIKGRIATGTLTVAGAVGLYISGNLSGNGPYDKETQNAWRTHTKWQPRSIKVNGRWVSYDSLEPFASFLAAVGDIGDNSESMGQAWTEQMLLQLGYLFAMNVTNKSFMAGVQPLNDIISQGGLSRSEIWIGNLLNNSVPWGGIRNELANIFNPGMREVEKTIKDTIMNRNPGARGMLPLKRDALNGDLIRDYDFPTRMALSLSPIQLGPTDNPTRRTLRESGYDLVATFATDSDQNPLNSEQRATMQSLVGEQNVEAQLTELFADPDIQRELAFYKELRESGIPGISPKDPRNTPIKYSNVYGQIDEIFRTAKKRAEVSLREKYPELEAQAATRIVRQNAQERGDLDAVKEFLAP